MPRVYPKAERWVSDFIINKWKWYIVDMRDWHKPTLMRKHFDNREQVNRFKDKYCSKDYKIIKGDEAYELGLKDKLNLKKKHRDSQVSMSKYEMPDWANTPRRKIQFRVRERLKMKAKQKPMKYEDLMIILEDRPILFQKRLKRFKSNHFVYSRPVIELDIFRELYTSHSDLKHLSNITRCLRTYYKGELGIFSVHEVSLFIYDQWPERVQSHGSGYPNSPTDKAAVEAEFRARGWVDKYDFEVDPKEDSYIITCNLPVVLIYPRLCWHGIREKDLHDDYIYDFHSAMGIPGYTEAYVPV